MNHPQNGSINVLHPSVELTLRNGHTASMSLSIGFALAWENASVEALLEQADRNMYLVKNQRSKTIP